MMFGGEQQNMKTLCGFFFVLVMALGCGDANVWDPNGTNGFNGAGGKEDSGWIGADSYEAGAVVRGVVRQETTGDWSDLLDDTELQHKLVDNQLKFVKNTAEGHG